MVDVDGLRADLLAARKRRDDVTITALRRAIAALEDAAAPPSEERANLFGDTGPTEIPRLLLTETQRAQVIRAEIAEARRVADQYERLGEVEAAKRLRGEVAILEGYVA